MRILFSHVNYPSQFRRLAKDLADDGHEVVFISKNNEWHAEEIHGVRRLYAQPHRQSSGAHIHPYLRRLEQSILEGQATYRSALGLLEERWIPDRIITHVGFGNGLFLSDLFPDAYKIGFFEWYYRSSNSDVDFLDKNSITDDLRLKLRTWNSQTMLELASCHCHVTPTKWQLEQFPTHLRSLFKVVHEGIDVAYLSSLRSNARKLPCSLPRDSNIQILTYVTRCFEEYRGFPQVMRTIEILQKSRPNLHVLIVGHDGVAYGSERSDGLSWGTWARQHHELDPARTHWLGILQTAEYHDVLACSDVHIYLTVPFVLSWSLLESMAAGCAIVASDTPPVREVLDCDTARLVDFFDSSQHVRAVEQLLDDPLLAARLAANAQQAAHSYSSSAGTRQWRQLLGVTAS